ASPDTPRRTGERSPWAPFRPPPSRCGNQVINSLAYLVKGVAYLEGHARRGPSSPLPRADVVPSAHPGDTGGDERDGQADPGARLSRSDGFLSGAPGEPGHRGDEHHNPGGEGGRHPPSCEPVDTRDRGAGVSRSAAGP